MDEYPTIDLSHLLPSSQILAGLPAVERIQRIRADRWIGYPRAMEALNKLDVKNQFINELLSGRKWLENQMKEIKYIHKIYPSDANFILFKVEDANGLYKYLLSKKVIVRNRDKAPLLKGCLRVSVGTEAENSKFIEALKEYTA